MKLKFMFTAAMVALPAICMAQNQESTTLNYKRRDGQGQQVRKPGLERIPGELVLDSTREKPSRSTGASIRRGDDVRRSGDTSDRRGGNTGGSDNNSRRPNREPNLQAAARRAADATAQQMAINEGFREYYQIGFHKGLKRAFQDTRMGNWDFQQGLRQGRRDPDAAAQGARLGSEASVEIAFQQAEADVERQFRDLSIRPKENPEAFMRPQPFHLEEPPYPSPLIQELFRDHPLSYFSWWRKRGYDFQNNWSPNTWRLYNASSYHHFYDDSWRKSDHGFDWWCGNRQNQRYYSGLSKEQQDQFKQVFLQIFDQRLVSYFQSDTVRAYDFGWNDGWEYGAWMNQEWRYRQGYHDGAVENYRIAAENAFHRGYELNYKSTYNQVYQDWRRHAKPEITHAVLADANGNGVFEPGEEVGVSFELVNYGGAAGVFQASLSGSQFRDGGESRIRIPARSRRVVENGPKAVVSRRAPVKQDTSVTLRLGPIEQLLDVHISWPLILEDVVDVEFRNNLRGEARVGVSVRNVSLKTQRGGRISMDHKPLPLGRLEAGSSKLYSFDVSDMKALDMLAGRASVSFDLTQDGRNIDALAYTFPEQASDLQNRDLWEILLDLARDRRAPREDIADAQDLVILRMKADWLASVQARGNPYKYDYKKGTAKTALGDLVHIWQTEKATLENKSVFLDLQGRLISLTRELKGAHPFLRKHFKRLAGKLR